MSPDHLDTSRRAFIALAGALLAAGPAARAQTRFSAPVVDRLEVQVLVDNTTFGPFLPDQDLPGLKVKRATGDSGPRMSPDALAAEFGLSLLAASPVAPDRRFTVAPLRPRMASLFRGPPPA